MSSLTESPTKTIRNLRRLIWTSALFGCAGLTALQAQTLDVPVMERADENFNTCAVGEVTGLNPKGDNFLAVRAGPGTRYSMIDKLNSKELVWTFDKRGDWIGVAYGSDEIYCPPIARDRPYAGPGRTGWVHRRYIRLVAG